MHYSDSLKAYSVDLCQTIRSEYAIDEIYYNDSVKRGLRNSDGTGVIAGVSRIGSVIGYSIEDGMRVAQPGHLYYRGYDVEDIIASHKKNNTFGYEETAYLLICGALPNAEQKAKFDFALSTEKELPKGYLEEEILKAVKRGTVPDMMNLLQRCILALYNHDSDPENTSIENVLLQSISLISRIPSIVALCYATKRHFTDNESLYIHNVKNKLSAAENFLRLIRRDKTFQDTEAKLLDALLILHAEHSGGNNSAFTCRCVSSTGSDTYSAIAAAIGSLKGPLHGGANSAVMHMIDDIKEHVRDVRDDDEIRSYLEKILNKEVNDRSGVIYGLGHAVYTISDPRAQTIKGFIEELDDGHNDEFEIAKRIESIGIPMLMARKEKSAPVCANLDLYSGIVYSMLGIPKDLYTPIFAVARISGWCAHRLEELVTGGKIMRPAYRIAVKRREFVPIEKR